MTKSIVLASANPGKLREFNNLLKPFDFDVKAQSEFDIAPAEETGLTFVENAILKARHASKLAKLPALADDSGIAVDALMGAPGIYSARFAGLDASDEDNNDLLLKKLEGVPAQKRSGRYHCVLVYMRHYEDPTPIIVHAEWEGSILTERRGNGGFGYDPLFYVPSHQCSSAELDKDLKNSISHRGKAMQSLLKVIENF